MVPGSTLMYGSSFRTETRRPRALSRRPMLAAVMPFPSEEVTPPVTKTYFAMGRASGGFSNATDSGPPKSNRSGPHGVGRGSGREPLTPSSVTAPDVGSTQAGLTVAAAQDRHPDARSVRIPPWLPDAHVG